MGRLSRAVCKRIAERGGTPAFILFPEVVDRAADTLVGNRRVGVPVALAYPIKTMPIACLLRRWLRRGRYVEASSASELQLALRQGASPDRIILSGPGKQTWLQGTEQGGLTVIIDSVGEAKAVGPLASARGWRVGLRFAPTHQVDPDNPRRSDQFGLDDEGMRSAAHLLRRHGVKIELLHFHLGGWTGGLARRMRALRQLAALSAAGGLRPTVIHIGGGFRQPLAANEVGNVHREAASEIEALRLTVSRLFPTATVMIAEVGRAMLAPAAAIVMRVLDVKKKNGDTFLICDGGRVNNALPSDWEEHTVYFPGRERARRVEAVVCGPTCMAWDWFCCGPVPATVKAGDYVVYDAAGAYHWSWQSSFSQPRAAAVVLTGTRGRTRIEVVAPAQSLEQWLLEVGGT